MNSDNSEAKKEFQPLIIMGFFWLAFGIIILIATLFVKETPQVPVIRGVVTNIIAGMLLLGVGLFCIAKGRAKRG